MGLWWRVLADVVWVASLSSMSEIKIALVNITIKYDWSLFLGNPKASEVESAKMVRPHGKIGHIRSPKKLT